MARLSKLQRLEQQATTSLRKKMTRAIKKHGLGSYDSFELDQRRGVMEFHDGHEVALRAKATIAGSIGFKTATWLWSWANKSIKPLMRERLEEVVAFGKKNRLPALTEPTFPATEVDGWALTAIAALVLDAEAAYRIPSKTGFTFVLLERFEKL